ncbi:MAG: hypothetical protein NC816_06785 [Candidatus Omnitrophica bacterium]|nr:hypothetical protein [Candidatus Omnitrophota bacterium]MCM8833604.1 hypothetical protein [Candidatus Omnitrophota bacterium]
MRKRICAYYYDRGKVFIEVSGIKKLRESSSSTKFKRPFGYSISGKIVEIGKNCKLFKIGQRFVCIGKNVIVGASLNLTFPVFLGNIDIYSSSRTGYDIEWEYGKDYPSVFVQWNTKRNIEEILILIKEKRVNVKSLITDIFSLTDISQRIEKIISYPDKTLGVILKP